LVEKCPEGILNFPNLPALEDTNYRDEASDKNEGLKIVETKE